MQRSAVMAIQSLTRGRDDVSKDVGCKTVKVTQVVKDFRNPSAVMFIIEQDWILNATKGWRRGAKRRRHERVSARQFFRGAGAVVTQTWDRW